MITDTLLAMLADPFRIALLVGLVLTQRRTAGVTGLVVPLATGVAFVAVLLPLTVGSGSGDALWTAVGIGLVANVLLLLVILLAFTLWDRLRR